LPLAAWPAGAATLGRCAFNRATLKFAGTPAEQAKCLLAPVRIGGNVGAARPLGVTLEARVGTPVTLDRAKLRQLLTDRGFPELAADLAKGVSKNSSGVAARYFVIHDTSRKFPGTQFPSEDSASANRLGDKHNGQYVAHLFINRRGEVLIGHGLDVPWRATQLEGVVGAKSRGLFLHVEHNQPRLKDPAVRPDNDRLAPTPGFSAQQYETSALIYVMASERAGTWLIPAFHAVIDSGVVSGGHDDPQNFDLDSWTAAVDRLASQLR
jgi:hypothetical protein